MDPNQSVNTQPQTVPEVQPVQQNLPVPEEPPAPSPAPVETNTPVQESPKKGSPLMIIAIILALVAVLAVVVYVFRAKFFGPKSIPQACTMDAKICPDGSSVGRTGPDCAFAPCPTPNPEVVVTPSPLPTVTPTEIPVATASGTPATTTTPSTAPILP